MGSHNGLLGHLYAAATSHPVQREGVVRTYNIEVSAGFNQLLHDGQVPFVARSVDGGATFGPAQFHVRAVVEKEPDNGEVAPAGGEDERIEAFLLLAKPFAYKRG